MTPQNILIIAITRMGDLLQSSPTIVGLKNQYPGAKITILVDKQFAKICDGIPGIDLVKQIDMNFLASGIWNGGENLVGAYSYVTDLVNDLKSGNFDFCLNMSNSNYTAILIKMLNLKKTTGWLADDKGYRFMADYWAMLFTACIYHSNRDYNGLNLVDFFRSAAEVTEHPRGLVYNTEPEAEIKADRFIEQSFGQNSGPIIGIQVGASQEKRQWAPKKFALLTRYLIEDLNARIIYTGAPSEEGLVSQVMEGYSHPNAVSCVGKTSIPELAGILKKAELLITGDTGPMHLSVAVGTPVVAVFLASALCYETGPYSKGNIVIQPQISCNPCNPNYPCARPDCHDQVSPELVAYLAKVRLSTDLKHDPFLNIPSDVAPPSQVRVFISDFDDEGYLFFRPLNGKEERSENPGEPLDIARAAYRRLWKEELAHCKFDDFNPSKSMGSHSFSNAIETAIELSEEAINLLDLLKKVALDTSYPASALGEIGSKLSKIERDLEELSLTFPILGTIVRIFILDKENLRGDDILSLTEKTGNMYKDLIRRLGNFSQYFTHYQNIQSAKEELV